MDDKKDEPHVVPSAAIGASAKFFTLSEIQDRFQVAILSGDDAALADIMDNSRTGRDVLFGVYRTAYAGRLVEIIGHDHDLLHGYLEDAGFDEMARAYVAAHPSQTQNARWFSKKLPDFLSITEPYCEHQQIADLARIEASLNTAFDSPDGSVLAVSDLASIPPQNWGDLGFEAHPSAYRLNIKTNGLDIWRALKDGIDPPDPVEFNEPTQLLIWRQGTMPMIRALPVEEAMMWDEAAKGMHFDTLCEMAATYDRPDEAAMRVAGYLAGWLGAGLLRGVRERTSRKVRATI